MAKLDWNAIAQYAYHVGLAAGAIALRAYAPEQYQVWGPLFQMVGQVSAGVPGVTPFKQDA